MSDAGIWSRRKESANSFVDLCFVALVIAWSIHFMMNRPLTEAIAIIVSLISGVGLGYYFYSIYRANRARECVLE